MGLSNLFSTGRSAAKRQAEYDRILQEKLAAQATQDAAQLKAEEDPSRLAGLALKEQTLNTLSSTLAGAGGERELPPLPEIVSQDPAFQVARANEAAQGARSQFGNALRNRTRSLGGSLAGSGNVASGLSGINLASDRAASNAYTGTLSQLLNQNDASVRDQQISNNSLDYQVKLSELDRPLNDTLRVAGLASGQGISQAGPNAVAAAIANSSRQSSQNAQNYANLVGSSPISQLIGGVAGAYAGSAEGSKKISSWF